MAIEIDIVWRHEDESIRNGKTLMEYLEVVTPIIENILREMAGHDDLQSIGSEDVPMVVTLLRVEVMEPLVATGLRQRISAPFLAGAPKGLRPSAEIERLPIRPEWHGCVNRYVTFAEIMKKAMIR